LIDTLGAFIATAKLSLVSPARASSSSMINTFSLRSNLTPTFEGGVVLSHRLHTMCEAGDCLIQVAEVLE
jgi:hypothetical protein